MSAEASTPASQGLAGQVALVTGAGGGIGRAVALALARSGARVIVNDLGVSLDGKDTTSQSTAQAVVEEIRANGGIAMANGGSVTDWDAAVNMVAQAVQEYGRLDVVVNNAGILRDAVFHKMDRDSIDAVLDVHLKGSFYVSRAAAAQYRAQGFGSFIHMSSSSAVIGNFGQANYAAAKLGIVALSKSIAIDMAHFGVRSNVVVPFAWTRMVQSIPSDTEQNTQRLERAQKMNPDRIGTFCVALSCEAARHVNGQVFGVRNNEIHLFSQMELKQTTSSREGFSAEEIAQDVFAQFKPAFSPLNLSADVFSWDPA